MQVILMEKVANLGQLGDVVKVKNGFGRNFLIPQGKPSAPLKATWLNLQPAVLSWKRLTKLN